MTHKTILGNEKDTILGCYISITVLHPLPNSTFAEILLISAIIIFLKRDSNGLFTWLSFPQKSPFIKDDSLNCFFFPQMLLNFVIKHKIIFVFYHVKKTFIKKTLSSLLCLALVYKYLMINFLLLSISVCIFIYELRQG